jgi:hypothetical protein
MRWLVQWSLGREMASVFMSLLASCGPVLTLSSNVRSFMDCQQLHEISAISLDLRGLGDLRTFSNQHLIYHRFFGLADFPDCPFQFAPNLPAVGAKACRSTAFTHRAGPL